MEIESHNLNKVKKYLHTQIDINCETALPGGSIYGKAWTALRATKSSKDMKIKIKEVKAYLIMRSENSKTPQIHSNQEIQIFEHKLENYLEGKKEFEIETAIPQDAFTSLDMEGFDFGEFKNILFVKLITKGSYLIPKKQTKQVHNIGQKMANLAPIIPEKDRVEKISMDGSKIKPEEKQIVASKNPKMTGKKIEDNSGPNSTGPFRDQDLFEEINFTHVCTEEIEIDHDTPGEKINLQKPIIRKFETNTGSCCCKGLTKISMEGTVYNPNLRSYADEIKFNFKMNTNGKNDMFKSLAVITSFGCVPAEDPRPDLMVWQALSIYRFFPDGELDQEDFDTKENHAYLENELYKDPGSSTENHYKHFVTNTEKSDKAPTHFKFPAPKDKTTPIVLFGKIKIGRRNGLGTFYSSNKVFKTMYGLKFIPVLKGSDSNGSTVNKGRVGVHLTIPISVKAKNQPTEADLRALEIMYQGKDREMTLNKSKLGKMKNMVVPIMPTSTSGIPSKKQHYEPLKNSTDTNKIVNPSLKGHIASPKIIEIQNPNYKYDLNGSMKEAVDDGDSIVQIKDSKQDIGTTQSLQQNMIDKDKKMMSETTKDNGEGLSDKLSNSNQMNQSPIVRMTNTDQLNEQAMIPQPPDTIPQVPQEDNHRIVTPPPLTNLALQQSKDSVDWPKDSPEAKGSFDYPDSKFHSELNKVQEVPVVKAEPILNSETEGLNSSRRKAENTLGNFQHELEEKVRHIPKNEEVVFGNGSRTGPINQQPRD